MTLSTCHHQFQQIKRWFPLLWSCQRGIAEFSSTSMITETAFILLHQGICSPNEYIYINEYCHTSIEMKDIGHLSEMPTAVILNVIQLLWSHFPVIIFAQRVTVSSYGWCIFAFILHTGWLGRLNQTICLLHRSGLSTYSPDSTLLYLTASAVGW